MKLTAIVNDPYSKQKNIVIERTDYKTKAAFKKDLVANGYSSIRIYTDDDFSEMDKGGFKTVMARKRAETIVKKYQKGK